MQTTRQGSMFYRIVYGLVCVSSTPFLITTPINTTRGHSMELLVPWLSMNTHMYSLFPSTMRIWNQLASSRLRAYLKRHTSCFSRKPPCKQESCFNMNNRYVSGDICTAYKTIPGCPMDELELKEKNLAISMSEKICS